MSLYLQMDRHIPEEHLVIAFVQLKMCVESSSQTVAVH